MLTIYKSEGGRLRALSMETMEDGCWFRLVQPTAAEMGAVAAAVQAPEAYLRLGIDGDGCPQVLRQEGCLSVLVSVPLFHGEDGYDTIPLSLLMTERHIVTISREAVNLLPTDLTETCEFDTTKKVHFFFQILYQAGNAFLQHITRIRRRTDEIELQLRRSTTNAEVFRLLNLEKGLTYFTAALRANDLVLDTVVHMRSSPQFRRWLPMHEEDEEILEAVLIENKRALALVQTYSDILSSMMDAFSSVIANNLNHIMKFLAAVTLLVAVPTMISSFWSMSMDVPFKGTEAGFYAVVFLSLLSSLAAGVFLHRKKML